MTHPDELRPGIEKKKSVRSEPFADETAEQRANGKADANAGPFGPGRSPGDPGGDWSKPIFRSDNANIASVKPKTIQAVMKNRHGVHESIADDAGGDADNHGGEQQRSGTEISRHDAGHDIGTNSPHAVGDQRMPATATE